MKRFLDNLYPLYRLYHKNQQDLVDGGYIDESTQNERWTTGNYKAYDRMESVTPSESFNPAADAVLKTLQTRHSFTQATSPRSVTRDELFTVLSCAYGVDPDTSTRPVASAGQLYPLEIYPLVLNSPDLDSGLYHYHPERNVLERPADTEYIAHQFGPSDQFIRDNWAHINDDNVISVMLLITGLPWRSATKYGERGYLFSLIETGELLHAIQLSASHLDIGSRPYAGFRYDSLSELLGLTSHTQEWVFLSVALAHPE